MIETDHKSYWKMFWQYFAIAFAIIFIVATSILLLSGAKILSALLLGLIAGIMVGLFVSTSLARNLTQEYFEINHNNKEREKGLVQYKDEIISALLALSFDKEFDNGETITFRPGIRSRSMGGEVKLKVTPYYIGILGPRGTVRILASTCGLKKIIL